VVLMEAASWLWGLGVGWWLTRRDCRPGRSPTRGTAPGRDGTELRTSTTTDTRARDVLLRCGSSLWLLLLVQKQNLVVAATPRIDPTCIWYFGWMCIAVLKLTCVAREILLLSQALKR